MIVNAVISHLSTIATLLVAAAALVIIFGLFWVLEGNAIQRGAVIGASSLSLVAVAACLDTYTLHMEFGALIERVMFSMYGPFMLMAGGIGVAFVLVGVLEYLFSDERREKRRAAADQVYATHRPMTFTSGGVTFNSGHIDVITNGGWGSPAAA